LFVFLYIYTEANLLLDQILLDLLVPNFRMKLFPSRFISQHFINYRYYEVSNGRMTMNDEEVVVVYTTRHLNASLNL